MAQFIMVVFYWIASYLLKLFACLLELREVGFSFFKERRKCFLGFGCLQHRRKMLHLDIHLAFDFDCQTLLH